MSGRQRSSVIGVVDEVGILRMDGIMVRDRE